jgi:putative multiple sugar transport system ATP-binding protein
MTDTILSMRGITKEFPGVKALADVNFDVARGEIHSICGENGAGKSTLMKVLSGVYPHGTYTGEIHYDGHEVKFRNIRESEHAGIAIIHQELALIPELTITENMFLGNEVAKGGVISWPEATKRARELLARVGSTRTPTPRSRTRGSASSSWSRSPRRWPRT